MTQIKSSISHIARNRATLRALGLHGIGSSVEVPANDATRGMVRQVRFLVSIEESGGSSKSAAAQPRAAQGGDEHPSERTSGVREGGRAGANAGPRRISGGEEKA
ncbi:MAG TPA: 50S ribosomal protein L30 [Candidatus Dormibacteraeota bacterium]|nr:50S ribosomal protein L30 [Candidatus Dormibacteraeota bacterium]